CPEKETAHRYCGNFFELHGPGDVLGLVDTNGTGKSTVLKILAGKQKANLEKYDAPPDRQDILACFRGSELQDFTKILEDDLYAIIKPQYVNQIFKMGTVGSILARKDDTKTEDVCSSMEDLSRGELQYFACAVICIRKADIFVLKKPSTSLDVKQCLKAAITFAPSSL
ncbi:hypothetical protein Z043_111623, partial [Scleropages formosus]